MPLREDYLMKAAGLGRSVINDGLSEQATIPFDGYGETTRTAVPRSTHSRRTTRPFVELSITWHAPS